MTRDNALFGVGLANYQWAFDQRYFWSDQSVDELLGTAAVDSPHSNVLWIASEMGVIACIVYVVANLYLLSSGWRAFRRARTEKARIAAAAYLAILVAYSLPGLTLASGYYSDLNLYCFFLLGLLSRRMSDFAGASQQILYQEHTEPLPHTRA
jgi:O-antigen ligase